MFPTLIPTVVLAPMVQTTSLVDYFLNSGLLGLVALLAGLVLLAIGLGLLLSRSSERAAAILLMLAVVPLALGAAGTWLGRAAIDRTVAASPPSSAPTPEEIEAGRHVAASSLEIGGTATFLVILLALACMYSARRRLENAGVRS